MGLALIDQDGVVADFERGLLDELSERDGRAPRIEIADRRIFSAREQYEQEFPPWHNEVDAIMHAEGFYAGLPEIPGAKKALHQMAEAGHEVFLCTAPLKDSPWCIPEKVGWVMAHLGPEWLPRIIITRDKTLIGARHLPCVLVDDRPEITGLAEPLWTHVLFHAAYNQHEDGPRLSCWEDWPDVLGPLL